MSPYETNHPQLAYIQPGNVREPPKLMAILGQNRAAVPLTSAMLWQLLIQVTNELARIYGPAPSERNGD